MNIQIAISRGKYLLVKHSPEILTGVGIVGTFTSGFMLHRAIVEANKLVKDTEMRVLEINEGFPSDKLSQNMIIEEYTKLIGKLISLFGPALALGVFSAGCLVKSNRILNERNAGLIAAYEILDRAFKRYREAVVDKYGAEEDENFRRGANSVKVSEKAQEENKEIAKVDQDEAPVVYGRWFTPANPLWMRDTTTNIWQLQTVQRYLNNMLYREGHVFLNEVYDELGYPRTDYGQVVGWTVDGKEGDGVIDFRIYDPINRPREEFEIPGGESEPPPIFLDFNVEGVIVDKI